jgi:hypothetical protein
MISHNGILSDCHNKRARGIDHAVHSLHGGEGDAYVNCDARD